MNHKLGAALATIAGVLFLSGAIILTGDAVITHE